MTTAGEDGGGRLLLKNGLIVDGTGAPGVAGDVLIRGGRIEEVAPGGMEVECASRDCTDRVIAPGFIDAHSHMDYVLPLEDHAERLASFTAQGCTTFVGGNCGFGTAGFAKDTPFREALTADLAPFLTPTWNSMAEYQETLRGAGMSHNAACFVGHGTTRASIRGLAPSPLTPDELQHMLRLLEEAMDEGAVGVSLGLQYEPGLFAPMNELEAVARLVKEKDKVLAVHGRAYSCLSAEYPPNPFGKPHNVRALNEMIELARKTGVRLQYSHLIFAGRKTHKTCEACLNALDAAIDQGVDIQTDTYPYHCGNSVLTVILPRWFRERLPENYSSPIALARLRAEFVALTKLVGIDYSDIQLAHTAHPELSRFNGTFMSEIAEAMKLKPFNAFVELAKTLHGEQTLVLLHTYSTVEIVDELMKHPASLFMTDAVPGENTRNPALRGTFPRFLQQARERGVLSLEETVRKMTGASADRFGLKDRGYLRPGMAADVTVFDRATVCDNTTLRDPDAAPTGIDAVFMNGRQVCEHGQVDTMAAAGQVIGV